MALMYAFLKTRQYSVHTNLTTTMQNINIAYRLKRPSKNWQSLVRQYESRHFLLMVLYGYSYHQFN